MAGCREVKKNYAIRLGHDDLLGVGLTLVHDERVREEQQSEYRVREKFLHAWLFLLDSIGWLAAFVFLIAGLLEVVEMCGYLRFAYRCMCLPW